MIEDYLVERKWLKKGVKVTHQIKSNTWINQTISIQVSIKNSSLERGHFSLVRDLPPFIGKIKFRTWKANMKVVIRGAFEMLSWNYQKDWSRKASNTQKRASNCISSGILTLVLSCKHIEQKDKARQPHWDSALDLKWFSFYMGEEWIYLLIIGLHRAINWTSHCYWSNELESMWLSFTPT
jgi:hypothetical protein